MCCVHGHAWWPAGADHIKQKKRRRTNKKASLLVTLKDPDNVEGKLAASGASDQLQGSLPAEPNMAPARAVAEPAAESPAESPAESAAELGAELAAESAAESPTVEPAELASESAAELAAELTALASLPAGHATAMVAVADALPSSKAAKKTRKKQKEDDRPAAALHAELAAVPQSPSASLNSRVCSFSLLAPTTVTP